VPRRWIADPATRPRSFPELSLLLNSGGSEDPPLREGLLRDAWIKARRGPKATVDESAAYGVAWEEEVDAQGALAPTGVVLLTNRECPFTCVMCDLWVNTLDRSVAAGAIPAQIHRARASLPQVRQVKLYNAGSYFDPRAIPPADDDAIVAALAGVEHVIVESHPAFLEGIHADRCVRLRDALAGAGATLEVAIGLETAHPEVLQRLNKRMTLESFDVAARFLGRHGVALRVFVLLQPPFLAPGESVAWACRSIDHARDAGAAVCTVIPTRGGNGTMETLRFTPPRLPALEAAVEYGLARGGMRVFADDWDLPRFFDCGCSAARADRLRVMNRTQRLAPPVACTDCGKMGSVGGSEDPPLQAQPLTGRL
jgi:archaeosine synthase beta-subunit